MINLFIAKDLVSCWTTKWWIWGWRGINHSVFGMQQHCCDWIEVQLTQKLIGLWEPLNFFSLQIFATFLNPTPPTGRQIPWKKFSEPQPSTLNPQTSNGPRFGECKYDLQKSCFYQEKKYLIVLQENSKQRTKDLWENSKQSIAGSTPLYCFDSEKLEIVL